MPDDAVRDYVDTVTSDRFGPIDFDQFHREDLPEHLAERPRVFTAADRADACDPWPSASTTGGPTPTGPSGGRVRHRARRRPTPTPWSPSTDDDWMRVRLGAPILLRSLLCRAPDVPPGSLRPPRPLGTGAAGGLRRTADLRPRRPAPGRRRRPDEPSISTGPSPSTIPTPRWPTSSPVPASSISAASSIPPSSTLSQPT